MHTLANKHQLTEAYLLDSSHFFKTTLQANNVKIVKMCSLEPKLRAVVERQYTGLNVVTLAKTVSLRGTTYMNEMIVSAGSCSGLPKFGKIQKILIVDDDVSFVVKKNLFMVH